MKQTNTNLSLILLDDDDASLLYLKQLVSITQIANVVATFNSSEKFVRGFPKLDFDLLILDIEMPGMSGKEVMQKVGKERCIVNTGFTHKYEEAIKCHPIDILIKPAKETHLIRALEKAYKIISHRTNNIEYYMFNVAENKLKVRIKVADILFANSDKVDPRNKEVILRNGQKYTLMNYSFKALLEIAPDLIQVNHSEAISIEIIHSKGYDEIVLHDFSANSIKKSVILSHTYHREFKRRYQQM